jgi:hypothetical protein
VDHVTLVMDVFVLYLIVSDIKYGKYNIMIVMCDGT